MPRGERSRLLAPNDMPLRPHVISVKLSDDELARLNRWVRSEMRPASEIIREALDDYEETRR